MLKGLVITLLENEIRYKTDLLGSIQAADLRGIAKAKASAVRQLEIEVNELVEAKLSVDLATNEELRDYLKAHMEVQDG